LLFSEMNDDWAYYDWEWGSRLPRVCRPHPCWPLEREPIWLIINQMATGSMLAESTASGDVAGRRQEQDP
jgi:hypothetical protein